MNGDTCGVCGGDGRIGNAFGGSTTTCPGCHGNGHKTDTSSLFRDVTKTKASHHRAPASAAKVDKVPTSVEGVQLAKAIRESTTLAAEAKARLIVEIVDHEATHGRCTKTFVKKVRKQTGTATP